MDIDIDLRKHLQRISETIEELMPLSKTYAAPAPESIQFLGTVVDNTVSLLTAPANAIDGGSRRITFEKNLNWRSLMQAVHRSFFSDIRTAAEAGLTQTCRKYGINVTSSSVGRARKIIHRLRDRLTQDEAEEIMDFAGREPQFHDYLDAVLRRSNLEGAPAWRKFFRALSLIRNKGAHFFEETPLSSDEAVVLREGGFSDAISDGQQFGVNPRMYRRTVEQIRNFFELVLANLDHGPAQSSR